MKKILSIFILGLLAGTALAATSDTDTEFFHPAASLYIQGDSAGASNIVAQGLSVYPEDGKLKRLKELLEQEQKQEQENQQNQDQEKEKEQDQEQENQDQNNQEDENPNADNEEKEPEQQNQDEQDNPQPPESEPEPQSSEQMSEDEAKQLLDAMKQEEKTNRMQLQPVLGAPVKVDKDW